MSTPILPFAVWASGTNQNSIPANDNSLRNQILNGLIISDSTDAQPATPANGDIYIITGAATGTQWVTFDEFDLAIFDGGNWYAFAPVDGVVVNLATNAISWNGGAYVTFGGLTDAPSDGDTYGRKDGVWEPVAAAAGDVVGPATATADAVALYDGTTGKLLKDGALTVAQLRLQSIIIACSDETTNLTAGTAKVTFRMPYAFTLVGLPRTSLTVAQAAGSIFTVDINEGGTSILSTKLTIDNTELTSTTAATPCVVSDTSLADDAVITVDIDQVGTALAKGLKVVLIGHPT